MHAKKRVFVLECWIFEPWIQHYPSSNAPARSLYHSEDNCERIHIVCHACGWLGTGNMRYRHTPYGMPKKEFLCLECWIFKPCILDYLSFKRHRSQARSLNRKKDISVDRPAPTRDASCNLTNFCASPWLYLTILEDLGASGKSTLFPPITKIFPAGPSM